MKSKDEKLWSPFFLLIITITFTSYICFHGLNSGTSVYLSIIGGSSSFAGILAAVYSISAGIMRIAVGPIIDSRGRSVVMSLGAASFALGALLVGLFPSEMILLPARIMQGIGFGAITTSAATAAADVLPKSRMGEGLGYYGLGNALSISVGPAVALFLVSLDPPENLYYVLAGVSCVVFLLALLCRYEAHPEKLPETAAYRQRKLSDKKDSTNNDSCEKGLARFFEKRALCGALPMMFMSAANGFSVFFAGLYGTSLGLGNAGLYFTFSAISMVLVRLKSKAYMDKILPIRTFTVSVVIGLCGLTLLICASIQPMLFYIAGLFYGFSLGMTLPINQSVAIKNTPAERWGAGNALFGVACDLGVSCTCVIWGIINDFFGFPYAIFGAMLCMVIAFILAWNIYPDWAKRHQSTRGPSD